MTKSETDILDATGEVLTLSNGLEVTVNRIKTRETFKLLKILTRGAGYALSSIDMNSDAKDFAESLTVAVLFAIPEAEDETIDFIQNVVVPVGIDKSAKTKEAKAANAEILDKFDEALDNPELDDLIDILTKLVEVEAPHIQELGKKIALLLKTYRPEKS